MRLTPAQTRWIGVMAATAALILPVWLLSRSEDAGFAPIAALFSGKVFSNRPLVIGGALDQSSLHKEFFILCYSFAMLCPYLALVRWILARREHRVRLPFAILSLLLLVHPLSILTLFTYDVSRYILRMGVTPMRLVGLVVAIVTYLALSAFAAWLSGFHRGKPNDAAQPTAGRFAPDGG